MTERGVQDVLAAKVASGRKLLVPFISGGFRDDWQDVVAACIDAGSDAVEIGIPFSDPVMDGPTIQQASERALARGASPLGIIDELVALDSPVPIVVMTYYNPVFHAGLARFADALVAAGVEGIILPDCPLEELAPWHAVADSRALATIGLVGPITPDDRLARVCAAASGYIYGVNLMGVTGVRANISESSAKLAARIRATTDLPVIMGFGISGPDQAAQVAATSDGVIIGSAIMRRLLDGATPAEIAVFVGQLRAAIDEST